MGHRQNTTVVVDRSTMALQALTKVQRYGRDVQCNHSSDVASASAQHGCMHSELEGQPPHAAAFCIIMNFAHWWHHPTCTRPVSSKNHSNIGSSNARKSPSMWTVVNGHAPWNRTPDIVSVGFEEFECSAEPGCKSSLC